MIRQKQYLRMASPARSTPAFYYTLFSKYEQNKYNYTTFPTRHTQHSHINKHLQVTYN